MAPLMAGVFARAGDQRARVPRRGRARRARRRPAPTRVGGRATAPSPSTSLDSVADLGLPPTIGRGPARRGRRLQRRGRPAAARGRAGPVRETVAAQRGRGARRRRHAARRAGRHARRRLRAGSEHAAASRSTRGRRPTCSSRWRSASALTGSLSPGAVVGLSLRSGIASAAARPHDPLRSGSVPMPVVGLSLRSADRECRFAPSRSAALRLSPPARGRTPARGRAWSRSGTRCTSACARRRSTLLDLVGDDVGEVLVLADPDHAR